jgi:hypothetical protein
MTIEKTRYDLICCGQNIKCRLIRANPLLFLKEPFCAMLDAGQYSWGGGPRPDAHVQPQPRFQPHVQMTDRSMVDRSAFIQYPNGKRQTQPEQANSKTSFLPDYPLGP